MIKLIASDLDGTLLTPEGNLPDGIFKLIEQLYHKNIIFCVASGRQLVALQNMFNPVLDKIILLAENGSIVYYQGQYLYFDTLYSTQALQILDLIKEIQNIYPLFCTPRCAYYQTPCEPFLSYVKASYLVNAEANLASVAQTYDVCKIAIYDALGPENNCMKILPSKLASFRVIQSGGNWLDISQKHTTKGNALRIIKQHFGLSKEECVAFGDHMNDYEMLLECGQSFVPENAYPLLKDEFPVVASNTRAGVFRAISNIADLNLA